jgi:predicted PurR-regulated permease PerM
MDEPRAGDAEPVEPLRSREVRAGRDRSGATPGQVVITLGRRQRRLLDVLLVLAVAALSFVVFGFASSAFFIFGDLILTFFLAWLIAFVLSPIVERIGRLIPRLPRVVAVVIVYLVLLATVGIVLALVAEVLVRSISDFVAQIPTLQERLPEILAPIQRQLEQFGLKVDLVVEVNRLIENIGEYATQLIGPLQSIAVASLGILGTTLIIVILSLYIIIDAPNIRVFAYRLVPPQYHEEWGVFEGSVSRSFGGFLRGQVAMGLVYGLIAAGASLAFGLQFAAVTSAASGLLQMIPFFGPFVSWAPPVLVAIFTKPEAILPTLIVMGVGWFFVMNILQPRLMQEAVGLHPIVVLASVLIGSKIAGIAGAIFGIPIAAVLTSIFFYYFQIFGGDRTVRERAARLVEEREGRAVRVPREPQAGVDRDITDPPTA